MITKSRSLLLAATLLAAPMGAAMAQQDTTTSGTPAYNHSARTQPNNPRMDSSSAATDPHVPGATGQTVVPGSGSSMAGSHRVAPDPNSASTTGNAGGGGH
jgi:hypothetical protein